MILDANLILVYGITFGIVLMTIIYTFVRYLYSKDFTYLSYAFVQFFSLLFIITHSGLFDIPLIYKDFSLVLASVFAVVFALAYSKGKIFPVIKNQKSLFIYTSLLIFIIATAFYHYILFEYLPYTIIYFLLFTTLVFNVKENIYAKAVYVVGWSLVCLIFYFTNIKSLYMAEGFLNLLLLAFAVEALLFTVSISYSYKSLENQNTQYAAMLLHQSKLAKTGQMIGNITHQFRQPLNNISYIFMNIKKAFNKGTLDEIYLNKKYEQATFQLDFLAKTIEDFKNFYEPKKIKSDFKLKDAITTALTIISSDFKKAEVSCILDFQIYEEFEIYGIQNELSQVILIILSNAKDALKNIQNKEIIITVEAIQSDILIKISDNANGIKDINSLFKAYYSSKKDGFGIGLYLAKSIIQESFLGKITGKNLKKGACFTLLLPK